MISPLFTTIVLVAGFIWIYMKSTTKNLNKGTEELLEKERLSNTVRRQPLNTLNYIDFNENSIPIITPAPNARIESLYNNLASLYSKRIVNLTGISNTDLKLTYGPANLPDLTEFDQNYTELTRNIYDLGIELDAEGLRSDAIKVLSYGVQIGTDISNNYIALANMYVEAKNYSEISKLIDHANMIHSLTKASTIRKLQEILDTHTTMVIPASTPDISLKSSASENDIDISIHNSDSEDITFDDNILPKDILDILETAPYKSDDQK